MTRCTTVLAAALLLAAPAHASDFRKSVDAFCIAMGEINKQGFPTAPGSLTGDFLAVNTGQTPADYRSIWHLAKSSGVKSCSSIW